jgi:hypothetical protein
MASRVDKLTVHIGPNVPPMLAAARLLAPTVPARQ